jgi:SAM-dependent methyltransferase
MVRASTPAMDVGRPSTLKPWLAGVKMGLASVRSEPLLGLKRIYLPASYWRTAEFCYVWDRIVPTDAQTVLDVGSPKDLAIFMARQANLEVVATDLLDSAIGICERYSRATGTEGQGPGKVLSEKQDARSLNYRDDTFDAAFSVSVLEHIPGDGDSQAIRELVRVVRPGGVIAVTVPYDVKYRETFVYGDVYERASVRGEPVFFERHYDQRTLAERLLSVPGTRLLNLELWGEWLMNFEHVLSRIGPVRTLLSPLEVMFARCFLRSTDGQGIAPKAAFFALQKLGDPLST